MNSRRRSPYISFLLAFSLWLASISPLLAQQGEQGQKSSGPVDLHGVWFDKDNRKFEITQDSRKITIRTTGKSGEKVFSGEMPNDNPAPFFVRCISGCEWTTEEVEIHLFLVHGSRVIRGYHFGNRTALSDA